MFKRIYLLVISLIIPCSFMAYGQPDFRDGYIITAENDTIYGKIDFRSGFKNRKLCRFKGQNGLVEYTPDQITGYRFINDRFYSAQIIPGTFVEVLVSGKLSLFRDGYDFYIQKEGDSLIRLETKEIRDTVYDNGSPKVVLRQDTKWKEILSSITSPTEPQTAGRLQRL